MGSKQRILNLYSLPKDKNSGSWHAFLASWRTFFSYDIYCFLSNFSLVKNEKCTLHVTQLHFTSLSLADTAFFTNWSFVETLNWASPPVPFFQPHLLISFSVPHFGNFQNNSNLFIVIITDLWWMIFDVTIAKKKKTHRRVIW